MPKSGKFYEYKREVSSKDFKSEKSFPGVSGKGKSRVDKAAKKASKRVGKRNQYQNDKDR